MVLKFEINEIWQSRNKKYFLIADITSADKPVLAYEITNPNIMHSFTKNGEEISGLISEFDLINYIGNRNSSPEYFL